MRMLVLAASCLMLGACATITRGSSDAWQIDSDPQGARVETTNGHFCEATPCAIRMKRDSEFTATVTKPGYKPAKVQVTNKIKGEGGAGLAGNIILGGVIGLGVDTATGAAKDLVPNPAFVKLEKDEDAKEKRRTGLISLR